MLPASNRGAGQNMGFPDVCNTPAGPVTVPIPYPNIALNAQASPFSTIVRVSGVNALNMGSKIPMTSGDEAGVAHPFIKQMGAYTMGNPIVSIESMPAINLTCPTTGNNMNNALGCVAVPSATTVFFTMMPAVTQDAESTATGYTHELSSAGLRDLGDAMRVSPVSVRSIAPGVGYIRLAAFTSAVPTLVFRAMRRLSVDGLETLVLDLRGNAGGDTDAMVRLADDFLPRHSVILRRIDADGDEVVYRARQDEPYPCALILLVDQGSASAAELFAGSLQQHRRAVVVGEPTYGKGAMQRIVPSAEGPGVFYATVCDCRLPDGSEVEGRGIAPDLAVSPAEGPRDLPLEAALAIARRSAS